MEKGAQKNTRNLTSQHALDKLKRLIKSESIWFFCTQLAQQPITTRPMRTQEVDENGNIWFLSSIKSNKNAEMEQNDVVQLSYFNPSNCEFLSVFGNAISHTDREKIHEMWITVVKECLKMEKRMLIFLLLK